MCFALRARTNTARRALRSFIAQCDFRVILAIIYTEFIKISSQLRINLPSVLNLHNTHYMSKKMKHKFSKGSVFSLPRFSRFSELQNLVKVYQSFSQFLTVTHLILIVSFM